MVKSNRPKAKEVDELRKRDAYALAVLIYDIYQDSKLKEKKNDTSIRRKS